MVMPEPPNIDTLREAKQQRPTVWSIPLKTITPLVGGGPVAGEPDTINVVRVPSIRGHLRFWWRALYGDNFENNTALLEAETRLWGGMGHGLVNQFKSPVSIKVTHLQRTELIKITNDTRPQYALWPYNRKDSYNNGISFTLRVACSANLNEDEKGQIQKAIWAWVWFGGIGGRTRRGLGSIEPENDSTLILDTQGAEYILKVKIDNTIYNLIDYLRLPVDHTSRNFPQLAGSTCLIGSVQNTSIDAWNNCISWLKDFRQKMGNTPNCARKKPAPGVAEQNRASVSRWPEADNIRQICGGGFYHFPRAITDFVWPRAGFGLPIPFRFQTRGRDHHRTGITYDEPGDNMLIWFDETSHDRLASPLILKPLKVRFNNEIKFVPIALWLNRSHPPNGKVGLRGGIPAQRSDFDSLVDTAHGAQYAALMNGANQFSTLREAFIHWLTVQPELLQGHKVW